MKKFLRNALIPLMALVVIAGIVGFRLMFTPLIIETGSMAVDGLKGPGLPPGSVVFDQKTDTLKPGDIISFQQSSMPRAITHTFIGYAEDGSLKTKGDANPAPDVRDVPLHMSDVIGKVMFSLPFLTAAYWVSVKGVVSLVIVALVALLITIVLVRSKKGLPTDTLQEVISVT